MKFILLAFSAVVLAAGCASFGPVDYELKIGRYADAYYKATIQYAPGNVRDRASLIQNILAKSGGAQKDIFFTQTFNMINSGASTANFFLNHKRMVEAAAVDGLLSSVHKEQLLDALFFRLEEASLTTASLASDRELRQAFPNMGSHRLKIATAKFNNLEATNGRLGDYLLLYAAFVDSKDATATANARAAMSRKVGALLNPSKPTLASHEDLDGVLGYIAATQDRSFDKALASAISKVPLTRGQVSSEPLASLFPEVSKAQMQARSIKVALTSPSDDFILHELGEQLKKLNDWIEIDDDAPRKLNFGRLRFQESRSNLGNMTQTVPDPDFATLLFIPRNASILFDYSTTDYALVWSMSIQDNAPKRFKVIQGQAKASKTECRNVRYQNVFGGIGALSSYPNIVTANFCSASANVDFDVVRREAVRSIASEINAEFFVVK